MSPRSLRMLSLLGGALLVALGLAWSLQGAGLLLGSVMSGQREWLVAGLVVILIGLRLIRGGLSSTP